MKNSIKAKEQYIIEVILFLYVLSLILLSKIPSYSTISVLIGIFLISVHLFFSIFHKKEYLYLNPFIYIYFTFLVFSLSSIFWASDSNLVISMIIRMTYLLATLIVIYTILKKYDIGLIIHYAIYLGLMINFIIYFNIIKLPFDTWLWLRYQGTAGNPNVLAIFALFSIFSSIILLYTKQYTHKTKYIYYINIAISIFLIILTASKKGILFGGLFLILVLLFSKNKIKIYSYILVASTIITIIYTQLFNYSLLMEKINYTLYRFEMLFSALSSKTTNKSSEERINFITEGFEKFSDNPFIGYGLDNFRHYFGLYAHNNYIELLFDVGIIGTLVFYSMYIYLIIKASKINDKFLKLMTLSMIFIILTMDIALVSYFEKFIFTYLILLLYYIEKWSYINDK